MSNDMTKEEQKIVAAVRKQFKTANNRDLKITNENILMLFNSDAWDDLDDAGKIALLVKAEGEVAKVSISDPGISALVAKINDDDVFSAEIGVCIAAAMKNKTSAVDMYAHLKRVFTKQELDLMPVPGTEAEHVKDTNAKPDKTKTHDQSGNPITVIWWNDFVSATSWGKEFENAIKDAQAEMKTPGSVVSLKGKSQEALKDIISDNTARRNALRSMMKRGSELHHQFEAVKAMPKLDIKFKRAQGKSKGAIIPVDFGTGKVGDGLQVTGGPKPLWLFPKGESELGREISVTQLLNYDIAKALKAPEGGTIAELLATANSEPDPAAAASAVTPEAIDTSIMVAWSNLSNRENMAALRKRLATEGNEDDREAYCALYLLLKPVYAGYQKWYEERLEKGEGNGPQVEAA
jgi:hypothetical protein